MPTLRGSRYIECKCGKRTVFPGYLHAMWLTRVFFSCECGRKFEVLKGKAKEYKHRGCAY